MSGVEFVGEIEKSSQIDELVEEYGLDAIEIHSNEQIDAAIATGLSHF